MDHPVLELKRKFDHVLLQECQLVAIHGSDSKVKEGKLFIEGCIKTKIEHAAVESLSEMGICGDVRHTSAQFPFKFCTQITFAKGNEPILAQQEQSTFPFIDIKHHGPVPGLKQFSNQSVYNRELYCKLVSFKIDEIAEGKDHPRDYGGAAHKKTFNMLSRLIVLHLMIEVLQVQQIPLKQF